MKNLLNFLAYNNAVPIALGVVFLGAGGALAASPAVQQSVYNVSQTVQSIDNTRIVNADIDSLPFSLQVANVTEDEENYYLAYTLSTIRLVENVWQDVNEQKLLTVPRSGLRGEDLGLYASRQLAEVRDAERARLKETQDIEKKNGTTLKVIATAYGGLVGQMFDPTSETFPGYTPVIVAATEAEPLGMSAPVGGPNDGIPEAVVSGESDAGTTGAGDRVPPSITILGNNPARIEKGTSYADLGVLVVDNKMQNIGYTATLDGVDVGAVITIDTTVVDTHTIVYSATDSSGNAATATRTVEVYDPNAPVVPPEQATTTEPVPSETPPPEPVQEVPIEPATTTEQLPAP